MRRCIGLCLTLLLLTVAGGCAQAPTPGPSSDSGRPSGADPVTVPVSSEFRVSPIDLSDEENRLINLVSGDSVSLFHFTTDPAWRSVDFWIESYAKGEKQPDIGFGGITCMEDKPAQGDIMIKVPAALDGYSVELAVENVGLARFKSDTISLGASNGHAPQPLANPVAIVKDEGIVLRVDVYNENTVSTIPMQDGKLDTEIITTGRLKDMNHVFIVKCRFSAPRNGQ